ncbi:MAG: hypothetical protein QXY10_00440, partial [Candidatus Micrarchaeaceae archaeon]
VSKREYFNTSCVFIEGYLYNNNSLSSTCLSSDNYIPLNSSIFAGNQAIISFFETSNLPYAPKNISELPPNSKIIGGG